MVCPHTAKPLFPPTPTLHGPNYTHKHLPTHICLFRQTIQKSMPQISCTYFFSNAQPSFCWGHTHLHALARSHTHTHLGRLPTPLTGRQTADLRGYNGFFFLKKKKRRGKHQNQPRPEIDEWWQRRWFWQAEWSRSLNGFIQEEIRNTHTHTPSLKCALSFQGWSQNKQQQQRRNLSIIKTPNPLPGWWWPWAEHVSRDCAVFMFRCFCVLRWIYGQKYKGLHGEVHSQLCVKAVISEFNLYIKTWLGKCHSLSSKASDKPNPTKYF